MMIPKECKRLAEVDFPISVVSEQSAREKSIRHGHPSTLHLWWARRPLAACRAMLLALLLPDPCDSRCPEEFKEFARSVLPGLQGDIGSSDLDLRKALLRFIGNCSNWDNASSPVLLEVSRGLIQAANGTEPPLVVDPFAGGGSIPLEALRLGCDAFASDINPVACLLLKTVLEDIPRLGPGVSDDLRKLGEQIKSDVEAELAEFYPYDEDGSKPIAYFWARTIICDTCGAEIPLVGSLWLCKKSNRKVALRRRVERPTGGPPLIEFEVFQPVSEAEVPGGTLARGKATCICCNSVMPPERVRSQVAAQHGGTDVLFGSNGQRVGGCRLLAVVLTGASGGREFRVATSSDYASVFNAKRRLAKLQRESGGISLIPNEPLPPQGTLGFRIRRYGMTTWGDLFSDRQKLTLLTFAAKIRAARPTHEAVRVLLAILLDRVAVRCTSNCIWDATTLCIMQVFNQGQAVPFRSEYSEMAPLQDEGSGWMTSIDYICKVIDALVVTSSSATVSLATATKHPLSAESAQVWFTDPPYYDAVPYADLSDFFFVWQKRTLPNNPLIRDPFDQSNTLTPKELEIVQDETKHENGRLKDRGWFEENMAKAFAEGRRILHEDGVGSVVFAHKTTEGWEALLSGMIRGGWTITGSWPIATESRNRLRAKESAALSTSVHLVCRPRPENADIGDWTEILRSLPIRVGEWIDKLQSEGIRGADLVFACIGPAMEVYSRYPRVEDAEGREIPLGGDPTAAEPYKRGFLAYVWETVGRLALEQVLGTVEARARNGAAGALEEDSRLTALFLWTLQATDARSNRNDSEEDDDVDEADEGEEKPKKKAGFSLIYDVARRFAQPLGIHLERWEGRIIQTEKGLIRLLPIAERRAQLFGESDASAISQRIEQDLKTSRNYTFAFMADVTAPPEISKRGRRKGMVPGETPAVAPESSIPQRVTTLDRLHAAMLLQSSGQSNGLRAMLREEQQRGPDFLRLANALSALYPKDSEEKRLLDAMLLAVPRG